MSKPTIFVLSSLEGLPTAHELTRQLEASAAITVWSEGAFHPGTTVVESLMEAASRADFAVFVLTPDDVGFTPKSRSGSPRFNVLFELGFLAGRIGVQRTVLLVTDPKVHLPSDLMGTPYIQVDTGHGRDLSTAVAPAAAAIRKIVASLGHRVEHSSDSFLCFISYSWNDQTFAAQLYDDLEKVGVRCWLNAKEMRAGATISEPIDRSLEARDKILLIVSQASINSSWIRQEIETAIGLEEARKRTVLFPIRLDDSVLSSKSTSEIKQLQDKYIVDFSGWQNSADYRRSFSRLVRDLAISASVESTGRG